MTTTHTPRSIEEVRAHAAEWMAKQDPSKDLPMTDKTATRTYQDAIAAGATVSSACVTVGASLITERDALTARVAELEAAAKRLLVAVDTHFPNEPFLRAEADALATALGAKNADDLMLASDNYRLPLTRAALKGSQP